MKMNLEELLLSTCIMQIIEDRITALETKIEKI